MPQTIPHNEVIDALLHIPTRTPPKIADVIEVLSRKSITPLKGDWLGFQCIISYVGGTEALGLKFLHQKGKGKEFIAFSDAGWIDDAIDRIRTGRMVIMINESIISWAYKKPISTVMSSKESWYTTLSQYRREVTRFWQI